MYAGKPVENAAYCFKKITSNSNWTEWSTIQGVIGREISKSRKADLKLRAQLLSELYDKKSNY